MFYNWFKEKIILTLQKYLLLFQHLNLLEIVENLTECSGLVQMSKIKSLVVEKCKTWEIFWRIWDVYEVEKTVMEGKHTGSLFKKKFCT